MTANLIDLNAGSGSVYGRTAPVADAATQINAAIDAALVAADQARPPRDYLGASRIGEPCARKLVYEYTSTPKDDGKDFDGGILRIFDAGHQFEDLCIRWLRAAGFDLRTRNRSGEQFGFAIADGRIRGHIDGAIIDGPDVGVAWPALWEHKALGQKSWNDAVKRGVRVARPIYFAQLQSCRWRCSPRLGATPSPSTTRSFRSMPPRRRRSRTRRSRSSAPPRPAS